jgi:AcrR family transcriptional regulator
MGRPVKGSVPKFDPELTESYWRELTGNPNPSQRDQFLWLAIDDIRRFGLGRFRVSSVAKRLGYSVAMVNHHFGSRDGLIAESASTIHRLYSAKLIDATENAPANPRDRLEAHIRARIVEGRAMGGWNQVLNFPVHSFESPSIAVSRAEEGFNSSFNSNLRYLIQLVVDCRTNTVTSSTIEGSGFPSNVLELDREAFAHASLIGTSITGIVSWVSGRIDPSDHSPEILDATETTIGRLVELLTESCVRSDLRVR